MADRGVTEAYERRMRMNSFTFVMAFVGAKWKHRLLAEDPGKAHCHRSSAQRVTPD